MRGTGVELREQHLEVAPVALLHALEEAGQLVDHQHAGGVLGDVAVERLGAVVVGHDAARQISVGAQDRLDRIDGRRLAVEAGRRDDRQPDVRTQILAAERETFDLVPHRCRDGREGAQRVVDGGRVGRLAHPVHPGTDEPDFREALDHVALGGILLRVVEEGPEGVLLSDGEVGLGREVAGLRAVEGAGRPLAGVEEGWLLAEPRARGIRGDVLQACPQRAFI